MLFDETTLHKLNQLNLVASKVRTGLMKGDRRSTKRGSSVEFADYRNYVRGDDLRRLDWNVYARINRPYIKLHEEEEDLTVHILVDRSASMNWGEADRNKYLYALRLAGAIGAVALNSGDRLIISMLYGEYLSPQLGPIRGAKQVLKLFAFLEGVIQSEGLTGSQTNLNHNLRAYAMQSHRPGLIFILSDFFSPEGYDSGLNQLLGRGYEAVAIHILSPDEISPPLAGDLSLVDCETGQIQEVSIDGAVREEYIRGIENWINAIRLNCQKRGVRYTFSSTNLPWDKLLFTQLRQLGVLK